MEQLRKPLPTLTVRERNMGFAYLAFEILLLPVLLQLLGSAFSFAISIAAVNIVYFSVNFLAVLVIFQKYWMRSVLHLRRHYRPMIHSAILGLLFYWFCNSLFSAAVQVLFPEYVNLNDSSIVDIFADYPVLMFLGTVILAPVAEEMLHRGLIFGTLWKKSAPLAYLLSAIFFASIHVAQYVGLYSPVYMLVALVQYLPAGLIFAWAYQNSGSIFAPILIHIINNTIAFFLTR